jgi:hypothetical protein
MPDSNIPDTPTEPISAQRAREILDAAIRARLGPGWNDEHEGWTLVSGHDFMARLVKGGRSVDFYVDLLGEVTIEEKGLNPAQTTGRLMAWMVLLSSVLVALILARLAGYL